MRRIAVIPNKIKDPDLSATRNLVETIKSCGARPILPSAYQNSGIGADYGGTGELGRSDMLVVLGGDGTILAAAREFAESEAPILGINYGHLGFLAEIERTEDIDFVSILNGDYTVARHMTLNVTAGGERFCALNDAVIHRGSSSKMLEFSLYIDDNRVNTILADGLIISTPTGSTAYSLSAGGPIADPALEILIVTPICPHDLSSRSIILPAYKDVCIAVKTAPQSEAVLTVDGQNGCSLKSGDEVAVGGGKKIGLVRTKHSSFYEKLRRKLYENRNGGC